MKKALITGITGQDGSYLADLLVAKGYEVHGLVRRTSAQNLWRIAHLLAQGDGGEKKLFIHDGDLCDGSSLARVVGEVCPDEIYNLAAQSHVGTSFETPVYTADTVALGPLRLLEAISSAGLLGHSRFYQASTSELYGKIAESPQSEFTAFHPRSPYAISKQFAHWVVKNYREAYGVYACNGILFNHESPRRGVDFVTRKITLALAKIKLGLQGSIVLGNLDARRDWGHARDYVEAQWLMLQQPKPDDYVIATGVQHSVRDFVTAAAKYLDMSITWVGSGCDEKGYDQNGRCIVVVSKEMFRPTEVDSLVGNADAARTKLGWNPRVTFDDLVREMTMSDYNAIRDELGTLGGSSK